MGAEAYTDVKLKEIPKEPLSILEALARQGWNLHGVSRIQYTDLGDIEDFDFKAAPISDLPKVLEIFKKKITAKEQPLCISVIRDTLETRANLLFNYLDGELTFSWSCDRRKRPGSDRYADLPWYEELLKKSFAEAGIEIESIRSVESD